jgi:predicted flap endonuclease-1-like 5' DNA nuclease
MIMFSLQTLFWVVLTFIIGLLIGRYIKGLIFSRKKVKADNTIVLTKAASSPAQAPAPESNVTITKPATASAAISSGSNKSIAGIAPDNLQIIEGIGPKMESVLKENGIDSLSQLANKTIPDLQGILNKYGNKYKIIQPATWVEQAKLAAEGKVSELITLQKVDGASKLEKILKKSKK